LAELDALRVLGLNPANALQHPGLYYYAAAQATERRRAQFRSILEISETGETNFPGLANERKVDHSGIVVEVRRFWRVWYSTEYIAERSCTLKRTSFSRSIRRSPTDMVRED